MLTASVQNMLVTSIDTTLETGVVPTQSSLSFRLSTDSRKLVSNVGSTLVRLLISAWVNTSESERVDVCVCVRVYQRLRAWMRIKY